LLKKTSPGVVDVYSAGKTKLATGTYSPQSPTSAADVTSVSIALDATCTLTWSVQSGTTSETANKATPTAAKRVRTTGSFGMTVSANQDACYDSFSPAIKSCLKQGFTGFYTTFGDVAIIRNGDASVCPSTVPSLAGAVNGGSNTVNLYGSDKKTYIATFTNTAAVVYVATGNTVTQGASVCGVKFDRAAPSSTALSGSFDLISSTGCPDYTRNDPCLQNYLYAADAQGNVAYASLDTNPDHQCDAYVGVPVTATSMTLTRLKNLVNNDSTTGQYSATYDANSVTVSVGGGCELKYVRAITQFSTSGAYAGTGTLTYVSGADNLPANLAALKPCLTAGYNGVWDNSGHISLTSLEKTATVCTAVTGVIVGTSTSGTIYLKDSTGSSQATYTASQITLTSLSGANVNVVFSYVHGNQFNSVGPVTKAKAALQGLGDTSQAFVATITKTLGCGRNDCFDTLGAIVTKSSDGSYVLNSRYGGQVWGCTAILVPAGASSTRTRTTSPTSYWAKINTANSAVTIDLTPDDSTNNNNAATCTYTYALSTFTASNTINGFKLPTLPSPAHAGMQVSMMAVSIAAMLATLIVMML
jgi:hypothetical protein